MEIADLNKMHPEYCRDHGVIHVDDPKGTTTDADDFKPVPAQRYSVGGSVGETLGTSAGVAPSYIKEGAPTALTQRRILRIARDHIAFKDNGAGLPAHCTTEYRDLPVDGSTILHPGDQVKGTEDRKGYTIDGNNIVPRDQEWVNIPPTWVKINPQRFHDPTLMFRRPASEAQYTGEGRLVPAGEYLKPDDEWFVGNRWIQIPQFAEKGHYVEAQSVGFVRTRNPKRTFLKEEQEKLRQKEEMLLADSMDVGGKKKKKKKKKKEEEVLIQESDRAPKEVDEVPAREMTVAERISSLASAKDGEIAEAVEIAGAEQAGPAVVFGDEQWRKRQWYGVGEPIYHLGFGPADAPALLEADPAAEVAAEPGIENFAADLDVNF